MINLNVLDPDQSKLLLKLSIFADKYYLAGGTAIALQIGHRKSIDFDLFTAKSIDRNRIHSILRESFVIGSTLVDDIHQMTLIVDNIKLTFLHYPFDIPTTNPNQFVVKLPSLETLGAMKAFTLGRRAKWKDYVDLYFILQNLSFDSLKSEARSIFGAEFNEKLFRTQLSYFEDIDFSEKIEFIDKTISEIEIKNFLTKISLE